MATEQKPASAQISVSGSDVVVGVQYYSQMARTQSSKINVFSLALASMLCTGMPKTVAKFQETGGR